ncbi:methyltransferase family protein [Kribbella sp. VKM Ac-2571]|uniref:class I SAM-dependent methyltransferase n=1 Tax=Kribbella sp. VKM Ac-2571 TaxID=2512222 RepID=UPI0010E3C1A1|nr:class I SAM-dependent methyltransferase [Kribbella sp. VKM Ac-2571]TDO64014.1 methyltransferase family protein [Kribbella sp. VKM Ac-2571]
MDWGKGSYEPTAADLLPAARELVTAANIRPGEHVVDVGAGTGNVALLAADLGARVTAVEPAARLREVIAETALDRDLTVVAGNAASIPLPDSSADVILSNFAVIFAPDPAAAIAELARVAKPASRILLTSWQPGVLSQLVGVILAAVREVTGGALGTPFKWHDPTALSELLDPHAFAVSGTTLELDIVAASAEDYWETRIAAHPLGIETLPLLEQAGRLDEVRKRVLQTIADDWITSTGQVRLKAQYLLATAVR